MSTYWQNSKHNHIYKGLEGAQNTQVGDQMNESHWNEQCCKA
jgi:hypothetical protein